MTKLLDLARLLLPPHYDKRSDVENSEVEQRFVEELTFASSDEIVAMLRTGLDENWIGLPVWARNLAFRLACLQRPQDAALRREAATDLLCFGPDWDEVAYALQREADALERGGNVSTCG